MVNSRAKKPEKENNKPLKVFKRGSIKVSIEWEKEWSTAEQKGQQESES